MTQVLPETIRAGQGYFYACSGQEQSQQRNANQSVDNIWNRHDGTYKNSQPLTQISSGSNSASKPLTGFAAGMQANNEGYRQLAMKNASEDDGKTFWERIGLTSTKDGDIVTPTTLETKTRGGAPASASTGDSDIDAYLRQMQETTARAVEDKREGVDEVDYGKLFVGTAHKGINQFAGGLTSTADWLIGQPLQAVGWKNNPVSLLNQEMKNEAALLSAKYDENAAKSIPAQLANKYGPSVVAALPQAALAYFTAGASLALQSSTKGLQLASSAAQNSGLISTIANAARTMMSDVQFWLPVAQTAGTSYEKARADGADDFKASVYATVNSLVNGLIERGGGGIQELPTQLRSGNPSLIRAWVFSSLDEGKEEVVQGVVDRILQKLTYGKNNPLFSTTDENAIFNPRTMAEDAAGGIAVGSILGAGQAVANNAVQNWSARQGGGNGNTSTISAADANRLLYTEALMRKAQREGNIYTQRLLQMQIEKAMQNFRSAGIDASAPMPTIYADRLSQYSELVDFEDKIDSHNLNVDLENATDGDTIEDDDIVIGKSLGAKAKNYDIMDFETGEIYQFTEGTRIQNVEVFAGKGTNDEYHKAYKMARKYGGQISDWQHVKGFGWVSTPDGDGYAEVHWSQCKGIGKHEFFIKRWIDR